MGPPCHGGGGGPGRQSELTEPMIVLPFAECRRSTRGSGPSRSDHTDP